MRKILIAISSILLSGCNQSVTTAMAPSLPVSPEAAAKAKVVNLPDLVYAAMPPVSDPDFAWDKMLDAPVVWTTNGFQEDGNMTLRAGWARIRAGGRTSTVLGQKLEEVAWGVQMETSGNPKFGPDEIHIHPGGEDGDQCFGTLYKNCTFSAREALDGAGITSKPVCKTGDGGNYSEVFKVSAPGKKSVIASIEHDEGSGGQSTELTLYPDDGTNRCTSL